VALRCGEAGGDSSNNTDEKLALGISGGYSYKLGYPNRNLASVAIAFDWIYSTLSAGDKDIIVSMLLRWFDWTRGVRSSYNNGVLVGSIRYFEDLDGDCSGDNNCTTAAGNSLMGFAYTNTGNNFFAGHSYMMLAATVAIYGENATADSYFDFMQSSFVPDKMLAIYNSDLRLSGGDSSEGASYYGGYEFSIRGLYAYHTATGTDISSLTNWPLELVQNNIHRLHPDLDHIPIWGDTNSSGLGTNLAYIMGPFSGINTQINPSETETGVMKWMMDNHGSSRPMPEYGQLLWNYKSPSATVQSPLDAGLEPFFHAKGTGLVTMRSSWTNADDTVFGAIRIEDKREADHENYDEGGFYVARGADSLIDRVTYLDSSEQTSTIRFDNTEFDSGVVDGLVEQAIARVINTSDYSYVRGDLKQIIYEEWIDDVADMFRRSFLFIRPNIFIISDVTKSNSGRSNLKDWYTQYNVDPVISSDTVSAVVGNSKVYTKTLYPLGGTFTKTSTTTYEDRWQVKYSVNSNQDDQFLHVVEAVSSSDMQTTATLVTGTTSRGVKVGNDIVAMFTSHPNGSDVEEATYTVDATIHYFADLPVNTLIDVTRNGTTIVEDVNSGRAGIVEFTAAAGNAEYTITAEGYVPPTPTCFDGIQNQDEIGVDCGGSCDACNDIVPSPILKLMKNNL